MELLLKKCLQTSIDSWSRFKMPANGQQLCEGGVLEFRPPGAVTPLGIVNLNLLQCRPRTCLPIAEDDK